MGTYRDAALWGDEHTELGETAVTELAPNAAVALSRGKFPKGYPHVDPNEDVVLVATDGANWVLAVADGHNGFDAAHAAMSAVRNNAKTTLAQATTDPESALRDSFDMAKSAIAESLVDVEDDRLLSATALTLVIIGAGRLTALTMGDTGAVLIRNGRARRLGRTTKFLNPHADLRVADLAQVDQQAGDRVLVASDGLFDFVGRSPRRALTQLSDLHPTNSVDLAGAAIERAFAGGAGDNIAVAVLSDAGR